MSIFRKLFGGGGGSSAPEAEPEEYNGFAITPEPIKEGHTFRIAARIEKEVNGEVKTHRLIRAVNSGALSGLVPIPITSRSTSRQARATTSVCPWVTGSKEPE